MIEVIDDLLKIGISLLLGSLLGLEREYHSKPAGFRTIALICVGATIFTILSIRLGTASSSDRIAANIVTGIGFIGAGVIFKSGFNVYGLTTAATIWVAAGMGMMVGSGAYALGTVVLVVTLTILTVFEYVHDQLDFFLKKRYYIILFDGHTLDNDIEKELDKMDLNYTKVKEKRNKTQTTCEYEIHGRQKELNEFNEYLLNNDLITSFEY